MPSRVIPTGRPMFQKIPRTWTPYAAETIEQNLERMFKYIAQPIGAKLGGTGLTTFAIGDLLYADTTLSLARRAAVAAGNALISQGTGVAPVWGKITLSGSTPHVTGTLPVTKGGTGLSTVAQGDLLYASAADTLARLAKNTSATRYLSNTGSSNNPAWAQVNLSNGVTGALSAVNGGTGQSLFTVGDILYADSTTTLGLRSLPGTTGNVLRTTSATTFGWSALVLPNNTVVGDLLQSTATNTMAVLNSVSAGSYLRSGGVLTASVWSTLKLPNAASQGEVPYASASNTLSMLAVGTAGQVLTTNGAAANPSWEDAPSLEPLTDGDATQPELIFASGDVVMVAA